MTVEQRSCANCGAAVESRYCGDCGQMHLEGRLTVTSLWEQVGRRVFNLERGWLATLRGAFTSPGGMIRRYVDGERRRYVNPITYLFVAVAIQLVLFAWIRGDDLVSQQSREMMAQQMGALMNDAQLDAYIALQERAVQYTSILSLAICLPFAVLLRLFFPGGQLNLAEAGVFALYAFGHAYVFDLFTLLLYAFTDSLQAQVWSTMVIFLIAVAASGWGFFGRTLWGSVRSVLAFFVAYLGYNSVLAAVMLAYAFSAGGS